MQHNDQLLLLQVKKKITKKRKQLNTYQIPGKLKTNIRNKQNQNEL
jgi:hypothetical protein